MKKELLTALIAVFLFSSTSFANDWKPWHDYRHHGYYLHGSHWYSHEHHGYAYGHHPFRHSHYWHPYRYFRDGQRWYSYRPYWHGGR